MNIGRIFPALSLLSTMLLCAACGSGNVVKSDAKMTNQVTLLTGSIAGNPADTSGIFSFKGIPYAAAPTGDLRWKAPEDVPKWSGVRDATQFGNRCWAATAFGGAVATANTSEDCLFVNVWTPAQTVGEKLPVMVWIHGGGFEFGSSADAEYDGTSLAKKGVIIVTMNYRLGVFGFLARKDLDVEANGRSSGMYGLEDQLAALRWVKSNVASFGGDPENVTVFGESAGAHAVGLLMSSPLAKGLFDKAIGESGAFWESEHGTMRSHDSAVSYGLGLGARLGIENADLADLRAVPALQLQTTTDWTFATDPQIDAFSPSIDGYVVPQNPYLQFMNGKQNDVPLLAGWNTDEGLPFVNRDYPHDSIDHYTAAASAEFGPQYLTGFLTQYPANSLDQAAQSADLLEGDQTIKLQTWGWVTQQYRTGHSPVYVYNFGYTSPYNPVASHLTEVGFVFGNLLPGMFNPGSPTAADFAISAEMQSYWTNFARSGNPNGSGLPNWPQYSGAGSQALHIAGQTQASAEEGTTRFQFLNQFRINGTLTATQK